MQTVIPLIAQDYSDWHKNRSDFCLWYIEINDCHILDYCYLKQSQFNKYLNQNYQRQFHISLFINGFLVHNKNYSDDFNYNDLNKQIDILRKMNLKVFNLKLSHLHAFDNCLSVKILEHSNLNLIRSSLQKNYLEISPSIYIPHITLGFYKEAFLKKTILNSIAKHGFEELLFTVQQLTFGVYNPKDLQGQLTPIYQLNLH